MTILSVYVYHFKINHFDIVFFNNIKDIEKDEFLIPDVIDRHIKNNDITVDVMETDSVWYGVTYKEDKESVKNAINELIKEGEYNSNLWG